MKLRTQVSILVAALFAVMVAAQLLVQQRILLPGFARLERAEAHTNMERVAQALRRELELLSVSAGDWGNWVDTWTYLDDRNEQFITENLNPESMAVLKADLLAFLDVEGRVASSAAWSLESGEPVDFGLFVDGALPPHHRLIGAVRDGRPAEGIIRSAAGPMLATISPVLDGFGNGPHRGAVLIGRLLTHAEVSRIGEQAQAALAITPAPAGAQLRDLLPAGLQRNATEVLVERDGATEVYRAFRDIAGRPLFVLRVDVPRTITAQGRETVGYASLFLVLAGAAVLALIVLFVNAAVLRPLAAMTRHAVAVGDADDLTARLALDRRDELGALAREFDQMVERLAEARRQVVDTSYEAGIAEMASGVLHNVGNAMTPLGVRVAGLRERLRLAPDGDVELALAELARCAGDAGRREELHQFLGIAAAELARAVVSARDDAAAASEGLQAIHEVLGEQTRFARNARVVEAVELPRLLSGSLALVPEAKRERLELIEDESLQWIGPVRVARITLQQVFQNLVVNAAEAARPGGKGRLVVRAARDQCDGRAWLTLRFEDDGQGIAAEHVERVFEKGFSTKPRETNAGIGLHWCANAMNSLGGSIRADSAGPGRGAVIELRIPLEAVESSAAIARAA
jgi:sensor domain CHASE-containing protein/two-component sensor histidine kinase